METIELQRIDNALVLRAINFVVKISLLENKDFAILLLLDATTLGIPEMNSWRSSIKLTPSQIYLWRIALL